jgi:hypothetical protein
VLTNEVMNHYRQRKRSGCAARVRAGVGPADMDGFTADAFTRRCGTSRPAGLTDSPLGLYRGGPRGRPSPGRLIGGAAIGLA